MATTPPPIRNFNKWLTCAKCAASAQRLADFASEHPVAHVFGTHIEQQGTPYLDFGRGTIWQRDEAPLELTRAHVFELNDAFISLHGENKVYATPDFTLVLRPRKTIARGCSPGLWRSLGLPVVPIA